MKYDREPCGEPAAESHPTGVRGLKSQWRHATERLHSVAPHWGAWIEIHRPRDTPRGPPSHPTGVRGLKLHGREVVDRAVRSHPTGVRGLKYDVIHHRSCSLAVAPHWGAWIEITTPNSHTGSATRSHPTGVRGLKSVDLRVERKGYVSHPTGVRGLKFPCLSPPARRHRSHPTGVRGLKFLILRCRRGQCRVAPHWGAWMCFVKLE